MTHVSFHKPVLRDEAIRYLVTNPHGTYVDGTAGGGGHAAQILAELSEEGHLYAVDQDEEALAFVKERFADEKRITLIRGNFGYIDVLLPRNIHGKVNGILLDLGVSSHQIDKPERGFSFRHDGPLDMRMGSLQTVTAAQIVNEYDYESLRNIFYEFGEERRSSRIARAIIDARPLNTTGDLREVVSQVIPERFRNKTLARIFQALRIEVNSELRMLIRVLEKGHTLLCEDGRFVVISYHSLEDRLCKNFFRYGNHEGKAIKDFYGNVIRPLKPLNRKVITASDMEIEQNSRARSAKLRAACRLSQTGTIATENPGEDKPRNSGDGS